MPEAFHPLPLAANTGVSLALYMPIAHRGRCYRTQHPLQETLDLSRPLFREPCHRFFGPSRCYLFSDGR